MGKRNSSLPQAACVQDADENGSVIAGTEARYARSTAPSSPRKIQPNTGKSRRESRQMQFSDSDSSDSTAHPSVNKHRKSKGKPRDEKRSGAVVVTKQRPSARSAKTTPAPASRASDESSYYAIPHHPSSARPRAHTRPESYYGQSSSRPPPPQLSSSPYYHQPPPQNMIPPPSFPPPSWAMPGPPPPMRGPIPALPLPPPLDPYHRDLSLRFRPQSAMGVRQASNPYEYDQVSEKSVPRRKSSVSRKISKENREQEDRKRMPPPPRPKSTRPERSERPPERIVLRGQPSSHMRRSVSYDDEDSLDGGPLYQSVLRRESGVEYGSSPFTNRRQSFGAAETIFAYEDDDYEEPAPKPRSRSRRSSRMGLEDKMRDASRYQDTMIGGPTSALTAEALKHVKHATSSHSTRSTESRDESDWKHSATTQTTRSSSGEDDITIKVPVGAVVEVGGTKIHCRDGGDISLARGGPGRGSDRGGSIYSDDRRSRSDRMITGRQRASSQAAYLRALPPAPGSYAPSRYAPSPLYADDPYLHHDDRFDGNFM